MELMHLVVFKLIARMQNRVIVGKLQITRLQHHVQAELLSVHDFIKQIQRFDLHFGKWQVAHLVPQFNVLTQILRMILQNFVVMVFLRFLF